MSLLAQNGKAVCVNPCTCVRCQIGQQCAVKLVSGLRFCWSLCDAAWPAVQVPLLHNVMLHLLPRLPWNV